jgi:hypothetical protein
MSDEGEKNNIEPDDGIGMSEQDLNSLGSKFVVPIRSRITKIGSSSGVIIPTKVLEHLGFQLGDYIDVILQRREPTDEELKKDRNKHGKKSKSK